MKTGKLHSGYHTSGGYDVDVKVSVYVSLSGLKKRREKWLSMWCDTPVVQSIVTTGVS